MRQQTEPSAAQERERAEKAEALWRHWQERAEVAEARDAALQLDDRTINRCARAIEPADLPPSTNPEMLKRKIARRVLEEYLR